MYFVTGNHKKFREAVKVFPDLEQLDIELTEIQSLDPRVVVAAKLNEAHVHHPDELVVEDISLEIAGLGNLPGTLIKWFLTALILEQIFDMAVKSSNPKAIARAILGYGRPGQEPIFIEESMAGTIVSPRGIVALAGMQFS